MSFWNCFGWDRLGSTLTISIGSLHSHTSHQLQSLPVEQDQLWAMSYSIWDRSLQVFWSRFEIRERRYDKGKPDFISDIDSPAPRQHHLEFQTFSKFVNCTWSLSSSPRSVCPLSSDCYRQEERRLTDCLASTADSLGHYMEICRLSALSTPVI